jgi:hypothetical protein
MTRMRPSKCTHCGKKYIHADLHMNICEAKPTQPTQDPKCPACKNGVEAKKTIVGEVELLCKAHLDELNGHLTTLVTPATKPLDEQIEQLLDSHAEYYIKETMQFFKNDGISPALSKNNKGDLTAKTAIKSLITNAEKQAYQKGYIDRGIEDLTK